MPGIVGTKPNQVPTNGDLGPLAFRDENPVGDVVGTSGIQVLSGKSFSDNVGIGTSLPGANLDVFGATRFSADTYGRVEVTPTGGNGGTAVIRQYTSPPRNGGDLKIQVDRAVSGGNLLFATGSSTETMRLDYLGNIGLGVVPSAWSTLKAIDIGSGASFAGHGTAGTPVAYMTANTYFNGTNWLYKGDDPALRFEVASNTGDQNFKWWIAPAGTAGATASFTQAMTLDASGQLIIGAASGTAKVFIKQASEAITQGLVIESSTGQNGGFYHDGTNLILREGGINVASIVGNEFGGCIRMAAGSGGIQFNGDTAAANALDDYEEGTFTPTIVGSTTAGAGTYTQQVGRYTKIGNRVFYAVTVAWTAHTGTGSMLVSGLPFAANSTAGSNPTGSIWASNLTYSGQLTAYPVANSTTLGIGSVSSGAAAGSVAIDTSASISISGHYEV